MNTEIFESKWKNILNKELVSGSHESYVKSWLLNSNPIERFQINLFDIVEKDHTITDILPIFLHGVHSEVFTLNWQMHCPHCNMITDSFHSLREAKSLSNCVMCEIDYTPDFQDRVEVTFSLSKDIEDIELPPFCVPPPSLKPLVSFKLPKGANQETELEIEEGTYRYFCPITLSKGILHVSGEKTNEVQNLDIIQEVDSKFNISDFTIHPGKLHVNASNPNMPFAGLFLHEDKLADEISLSSLKARLSGIFLQHFPLFPKLFGAEVLSGRERLMISSVTILFTDITASTKMYETLGDIKAYNLVRDHFEIFLSEIEASNGIIIKTIGDAVMASFKSNEDSLKAIFNAKKKINEFNLSKNISEQINLKIGIHRGPAILVNLNERLDYFGSTINKAARIQSLSRSEQVSISENVFEDKSIQKFLARNGINRIHKTMKNLKGLEGEHAVYQFNWDNS